MVSKSIITISISLGSYAEFIEEILTLAKTKISSYVCVANVHMLIETYKNKDFQRVVNGADIVTPDGLPVAHGLKFLYKIKQERVAGMDILPDLLRCSEEQNLSVYFYGGTQEMLNRTEKFCKQRFPALKIVGMTSPPFRELTETETKTIIHQINKAQPHFVFVALGCPKQEKWMAAMKGRISACMLGIGGALPVMIGLQKRAPVWMQKYGLEWFFRLLQEPRRLFRRYFVTNSIFLYLILREKITILCRQWQTKRR